MRKWLPFIMPLAAGLMLWSGFTLWALTGPHDSMSFGQLQARLFGDWLDFRSWNTPSINRIEVADGQALVSPVLAVAAWVALGALLLSLLPLVWTTAPIPRRALPVMVLTVAAGWLLLDIRWQGELAHRLSETRAQFAGKSWEEKRALDFDGPEFEFMQRLKVGIGDPAARVMVLSGTALYHFRARYHVLPQPAWSSHRPPPVRLLRPGDYVVLLDDRVMQPGSLVQPFAPTIEDLSRRHELRKVDRNRRMFIAPRHAAPLPGIYALRTDPEGGGEVRLQVRYARNGGDFRVIAERSTIIDPDSDQAFELPFLVPAPGEVEYRLIAGAETDVHAESVTVDWLPNQERLAFLAAEPGGPFVVVRLFLQSEVAIAFEVL